MVKVSALDELNASGVTDDSLLYIVEGGVSYKVTKKSFLDNFTNPLLFKGSISTNVDFPTTALVKNGWFYTIAVDVTDNNPAKTNTGQSFIAGDEIAWNGTNWTEIGSIDVWSRTGTVISPVNAGDDVNMTGGKLTLESAQFDLTPTVTMAEGVMAWDSTNGTVQVGMPGGNVNLQLGQEQHIRAKATETILDGQVVRISGASGNKAEVSLVNNLEEVSVETIAVATENVTSGHQGYFTTFGLINDIDTNHLTEGASVYLGSTDGSLTSTHPSNPSNCIVIGTCIVKSATEGKIFVNINSKEIHRDRDLLKNPTGFVKGCIVTGTANRTVVLSGTVEAYWKGDRITSLISGWESTAHGTDTSKLYYLYYNGSTIAWYDSVWTFDKLQIALAFYDATLGWVYQRECHGFMPSDCHENDHFNVGSWRHSGGDIGSVLIGSTTTGNRRPTVSEMVHHDEDLETIQAEIADDTYTLTYLTSTGIATFVAGASDIDNLLVNNPYYNSYSAPNWGQTLMPANSVMSIWLISIPMASDTNSQKLRFIWLQGQWITQATGAGAPALASALSNELLKTFGGINLGNLLSLSPEILPVARITITYTGGNWYLSSVNSLTGSRYQQTQSPAGTFLSTVTTDTTLTGNGTVTSPIGVANALTLGTGLSGTSYNGSSAVTTAVNYGTTATTACVGNDARLSDSRKCNNTFDNATTAKTNLSLNNVENTALSTWTGTSNIITLGTIITGIWNAGAVTSSGTISGVAGGFSGKLTITESTDASSGAGGDGSIKTAGGIYVTKSIITGTNITVGGQRLNIGTAGTTWSNENDTIEIGSAMGVVASDTTNSSIVANNAIYNSEWKYKNNGYAGLLDLNSSGEFKFRSAPSGSAGGTATFTDRLVISNTGVLSSITGITMTGNVRVDTGTAIDRNISIWNNAGTPQKVVELTTTDVSGNQSGFIYVNNKAGTNKISLNGYDGTVTASGRIISDDTTDATTTTNGSIQTDGGLSVVKDVFIGGGFNSYDGTDTLRMLASGGSGYIGLVGNHPLYLRTNNTVRLTIAADGNVGLGVTPKAWNTGFTALQIGGLGAIWNDTAQAANSAFRIANNIYYAGGIRKYIVTDNATEYSQDGDGVHRFKVAASGNADAEVTLNTEVTIASGLVTLAGNLNAGHNGGKAIYSVDSSIADDGTATHSIPHNGCIILFQGQSGVQSAVFACTSASTLKLIATPDADFSFGTTTNPDTDGDWNFWVGTEGTLSIKNRTGSSRYYCLTILSGQTL